MKAWFKSIHGGWKLILAFSFAVGVMIGTLEGLERIGMRPVTNGRFDRRMIPVEEFMADARCDRAEDLFYSLDRQKRAYEEQNRKKPLAMRRRDPVPRDLLNEWRYRARQKKRYCGR